MFSCADKIIEYNNKYYILDKSSLRTVVSFKKDGTPDTKYGRIGQGPGEYVFPWDMDIDETGVYVLDTNSKKVIHYNESGNLIGERKIPFFADAIKRLKNGNFIFNITPDGTQIPSLIYTDSLMNPIWNSRPYQEGYVGGYTTCGIFRNSNLGLCFYRSPSDSLAILDENGKLLPKFVVVRNGIEESEHVVRGNETVIGARLSDARFFYNEDLKKDMEEFVESLKTVVFQKDLGTIYAKVERSKTLAEYLIKELKSDKLDSVLRTVHLAKADLMSNMIGEKEFTKLQGFMGHQYAMVAGEDKNVALGIEEHYLPRFQGDSLPTTFEGAIAGIVDKVDTLVGCFGIGMKPSGSKDPYALRRATLGIVNVLLNSKISISIKGLIENSLDIYESHGILKTSKVEVFDDIYEFFKQRIINVFTDKGYKKDIVNAVVNVNFDNLVELEHKVQTLEKVSIEPEFNEIINLLKRIENIIKDSKTSEINKELLKDEAEIALVNFAEEFNLKAQTELSNNNYEKYFKDILSGKTIINNFFEFVMVMDKDEMI